MRRLLIWSLLALAAARPAFADESAVKDFSGTGTTTTAMFHVHDRWEVRWSARRVVSVAVMAANGTIVTGAAGVLRGSLFIPAGGDYYLRIADDSTAAPDPKSATPPPAAHGDETEPSWHLQIIELGPSVASTQVLTVYAPYFAVPDSAVTVVPQPTPPPTPKLADEQARAVVTIKGDTTQGAGFLVRSPHGLYVLTHLHLLANNPNVQILSLSGGSITPLSVKGATNRDLALFAVKDDHEPALPLPADDAVALTSGEFMLVPALGAQAEVTTGRAVHVIGISPERIDFDQPMDSASDGAPVIQARTGFAVGILTAEKKVDVSSGLAKAWMANPAPGSASIIPTYGLPVTVVNWENYDLNRFLGETQFLAQFHETTRCLDSYLNGRGRKKSAPATDDGGPPDNRYYAANPKLRQAQDNFGQLASGADQNQQIEAATELLNDLQGVADTDLATLQDMAGTFYVYDQQRAREELAYRKALKKQLDDLSYSPGKLDEIARAR